MIWPNARLARLVELVAGAVLDVEATTVVVAAGVDGVVPGVLLDRYRACLNDGQRQVARPLLAHHGHDVLAEVDRLDSASLDAKNADGVGRIGQAGVAGAALACRGGYRRGLRRADRNCDWHCQRDGRQATEARKRRLTRGSLLRCFRLPRGSRSLKWARSGSFGMAAHGHGSRVIARYAGHQQLAGEWLVAPPRVWSHATFSSADLADRHRGRRIDGRRCAAGAAFLDSPVRRWLVT